MTKRILPGALALATLAFGFNLTSPIGAWADESSGGGNSTSINCLSAAARELILGIEARFGQMEIISTCRPGARVAGTGQLSRHSSGNAIDFVAGSRKGAVVAWLIANHTDGGTMTYSNSPHIHVDIGPRWVQLAGGSSFVPGQSTGHGGHVGKVRKQFAHHRVQADPNDGNDGNDNTDG